MTELAPHHIEVLTSSAIDLDVAIEAGVRSEPGRLVFQWTDLVGNVVEQIRGDHPGDGPKYLFPRDTAAPLWVHPRMRDRVGKVKTVVFVEGTKQYLAAVSAAGDNVLVVGMAGCWGWSHNQMPSPHLEQITSGTEDVVISLDADVASNLNVWLAAKRLADAVDVLAGIKVRYLTLPAGGKAGLDDFLATVSDRPAVLARLITNAGRLPRKPKAAEPEPMSAAELAELDPGGQFFHDGGLLVDVLYNAIVEQHHLALDRGDRILVYEAGVYRADRHQLGGAVADRLVDRYRPMHLRALEEYATAKLGGAGRIIPEQPVRPWINCRNGMLDPATRTLHPHHPDLFSVVQFPIGWDPTAASPVFDRWLVEVTGDQADDLLEAVARLLDKRPGRQRKAVFLYGPSRSGKSTLVRTMEKLVGHEGRAAVTLHQLGDDRFAAADLYGKVLNAAADLSGNHVEDLSAFKMLVGDDPVRAQRKFGQPFVFRNTALFLFSTNAIPTVGEVSRAYLSRIRPYRFATSFEGREDETLEEKLTAELPGILVKLVDAYQRYEARGGYADTDAMRATIEEFARHSDRVHLFIAETCERDDNGFTSTKDLFIAFGRWCELNRRQGLGKQKFLETVRRVCTERKRDGRTKGGDGRVTAGFDGLVLLPESEWGDGGDFSTVSTVSTSPSPHEESDNGGSGGGHEEVLVRRGYGGTDGNGGEIAGQPDDPDAFFAAFLDNGSAP